MVKQTYKNLEIILVDDGSSDRCSEICDLYAKKDNRIKVIHKVNSGLVSARKAGLEIANGVYVGYVDGDDWIESGFYQVLHKAIVYSDADIVVTGQSRDLFNTSSKIVSNIPAGLYVGKELTHLIMNMLSYGEFFRVGITTYVWNKLFKRELLLKHQNAVDNEISIGEDAAVVYPYITDCEKVCIIDTFEYHYRQREDSMLKRCSSFTKEVIGLRKLYRHLTSFSTKLPSYYRLMEQVNDFMLGTCIIRSGGILLGVKDYYSAFNNKIYGRNVVIWSAGTFGQQLMYRIKENNYCNVVGWLDIDYWEYRRCCLDVDSIDAINTMKFDYILIATLNSIVAESMRVEFILRGINESKILTVYCPKEERTDLLQKYLNNSRDEFGGEESVQFK